MTDSSVLEFFGNEQQELEPGPGAHDRADSPRLLISRMLQGQFPNYDMVMPKTNDKSVQFDGALLNSAIRRVALMSDERSHAIRFHLEPNQLVISAQNAEEGEARETVQADYNGEETEVEGSPSERERFSETILVNSPTISLSHQPLFVSAHSTSMAMS